MKMIWDVQCRVMLYKVMRHWLCLEANAKLFFCHTIPPSPCTLNSKLLLSNFSFEWNKQHTKRLSIWMNITTSYTLLVGYPHLIVYSEKFYTRKRVSFARTFNQQTIHNQTTYHLHSFACSKVGNPTALIRFNPVEYTCVCVQTIWNSVHVDCKLKQAHQRDETNDIPNFLDGTGTTLNGSCRA